MKDLLDDREMPDARWNFEVNLLADSDDTIEAMTDAFVAAIVGNEDRVCVHWGRSLNQARIAAFRDALPVGTCYCASTLEREQDSRFPPLSWLASRIDSEDSRPSTVDCFVVVAGTASSRPAVGTGVVVMSWPLSGAGDDLASLVSLLELELDGVMTNSPDLLKIALQDRGMWPSCFEQPVREPVPESVCDVA